MLTPHHIGQCLATCAGAHGVGGGVDARLGLHGLGAQKTSPILTLLDSGTSWLLLSSSGQAEVGMAA